VKGWIERVEQWHSLDFPDSNTLSFEVYLGHIVIYSSYLVRHRWQQAGREADARGLTVIHGVWNSKIPSSRLARYDAMDYLAEHMSWADAEPTLLKGRKFAVEELRSYCRPPRA
jgi:hypothetical protein